MRLTFLGATRTVTGSKYLLELNGARILLECGMYHGRRAEWQDRNTRLPLDAAGVEATLLSHAHIDHSGIIPVLTKCGFGGKIFCTEATADLCRVMLMDSAFILEQDAAFVSKLRARKKQPPVGALYTRADAEASLRCFSPVPYHQPLRIAEGVTATWREAGHMLGSAMIVLDLEEKGRKIRFAFSGDLGRGRNDILPDPDVPDGVDYLMMESTYGNRQHESRTDVDARLCAIITRAVEAKGKIIIPAFAVGRTQQLLHTLHRLEQTRCIPRLPIFVDSPLAHQATEVFHRHPECFNKHFREAMRADQNALDRNNVTFIGAVEESMALNDRKGPCVIIAASGMAEAGRIRHHIKNAIGNKRNTILIVSWCSAHTLGSRLASGHKEVNIFGEPHKVRAHIETINAFSGHADRNELAAWLKRLTGNLRGLFVIHGEEEAAVAWGKTLSQLKPRSQILVPNFGDSVQL